MLKHREDSPIAADVPMSPTTRRKTEFLLRQLPNDVMVRARSTLSSFGDAWRPKSYGGSSNNTQIQVKNTKSVNRSTLDFFLWSRHKNKKKDKKIVDENDKDESDIKNKNTTNSSVNYNKIKGSDMRVLVDNSNKNKLSNSTTSKSIDTNHNNKLTQDKKAKKIIRNKSLDMDEHLMVNEIEDEERLSRSVDDSINYLMDDRNDEKICDKGKLYQNSYNDEYSYCNRGCVDILPNTNTHRDQKLKYVEVGSSKNSPFCNDKKKITGSNKTEHTMKKLHVKSSTTLASTSTSTSTKDKNYKDKRLPSDIILEFKNSNTEGIEINDSVEGVVNARLRLQKFGAVDDSVLQFRPSTRPIPLFRHNSVETKMSSSFPERSISPTILEENTSDEDIYYRDEDDVGLKIEKPRKKLSFRDPEVVTKSPLVIKLNSKIREITPVSGSLSNLDLDLESQAMRIVRTVGQAFEVCHKKSIEKNDDRSGSPCDDSSVPDHCSEVISDDDEPKKEPIPVTPEPHLIRPNHLEIMPQLNYNTNKKSPILDNNDDKSFPPSTSKEVQRLREQLEGQSLQTRQAVEQLMLVRGQLISETNARMEAQARTQQLLQQNRELLEHIASLGGYHEPDRPGYTTAQLGIAPQSPLPIYMPDQTDLNSPLRKTFVGGNTITSSSSLSALNQQWNNLGAINQQLSTLSQQLNGLNQQNHNLQNLQQQIQTPQLNHINKIGNIQQQNNDMITQQDLFQLNQDLLNRLQNLNLGYNNNNNNSINNNASHNNSYLYSNQNQNQFSSNNNNSNSNSHISNNNNYNLLSSPSSVGNLTPSPIGTLNRNSYSVSPLDDNLGLIIDRNFDLSDDTQFIKPLSQVGTLTTLDNDGKIKVIVPISTRENINNNYDTQKRKEKKNVQLPSGTVTLKVTDESGNITNTKKLPATPSFITRSTSEKVPNRSQMMSQVQRTTWARHTTK